jgi:hypothetical protein
MIPKSICAASLSAFIAPAAYAVTVSVPVKSQPESITVAANGDLMLGSAGSTKIYRAKKGSDKAEVFIDVSADGAGTFLGVLDKLYRVPMDASGNAGKPVDIWMDKPVKGPDGMRAANGKLFLAENGAGKIDMVTVSGDTAKITVLQEGLATPTAIEPAGDTLWYGERAGDRAHSMPLPK